VSTAAGGSGVLLAGFLKRDIGLETVFAGISFAFILAGVVLLLFYRFFMRRDTARAQAIATAQSAL
jgi:hypothetical protein